MNTPAHMIIGASVFGKPGQAPVTIAAVLGGLLPDIPLMVMVGWAIWVRGIPPQVVFDDYYFSPEWQAVFAIDHGFLFWGAAFLLGVVLRWQILAAFAGSGFLHAAVDFLVHHDDARAQFWPLTSWRFHSPVSYWDRAHFGQYFGPFEVALCLVLCFVLWRRFHSVAARALIVFAAVCEAAPGIMFAIMLSGGPK